MTEPENSCDDPSVLFETARKLDGPERQAYLDHACQGKPALKSHIESMIDAHAKQGEFLADPTVDVQPREIAPVGSMIGPYKLLQQIGEGGMGVVYISRICRWRQPS